MTDQVFIESWQGYPADFGQASDGAGAVWTQEIDSGGQLTFTQGRFTFSRALSMHPYCRLRRPIPVSQTFNLRFVIKYTSNLATADGPFHAPNFFFGGRGGGIYLLNSVAQLPMIQMTHDNLGRPIVTVGGVDLATPVAPAPWPQFQHGRSHHIEFVGKVGTVADGGYLKMLVDGVMVYNTTCDYTGWTGTVPGNVEKNVGIMRIETNGENYDISDIIMYPDDTLRGEHTLWTGTPNGNAGVQFTPLAPNTNWQNISEVAADDDTTYNSSNTIGQTDLFSIPAIPATPTNIEAVQVGVCWRKDDSGTRQMKIKLTDPSGNQDGTVTNLTVSYGWQFDAWKKDASTAAWTKTHLAATTPGYSLVA